MTRPLKDNKPAPQPLFTRKQPPQPGMEDLSLSRFHPAVKAMLEEQLRASLDQAVFPFTKPLLDANEGLLGQNNISQASLRSAKPTWARTRPSAMEPRQRIIVFIAGGATYSESRACYELSRTFSKDIYLATSHMLTPNLFLRQVRDLSVDKRQLDLPIDRPKPKPPAHLFERETGPAVQPAGTGAHISTNGAGRHTTSGSVPTTSTPKPHPLPSPSFVVGSPSSGKPAKEAKEKKRRFFNF